MNGPDKPFNELTPAEHETENRIRAFEELDETFEFPPAPDGFEEFLEMVLAYARDADSLYESGTLHLDFSNQPSEKESE